MEIQPFLVWPGRITLAFRVFLCAAVLCPAVYADELAERVEAAVPEGFSGQVVIGDENGILYSGNFGMAERESGVPVDTDTVFDIGSVTKTFTATAILQLASDGKVTLDQALGDWFDGLPDATSQITIHQLLSHTSGLPLYSGDDDTPCDRECFDTWLAKTSLTFPPGERFEYSNPGYSALARIIEKASGQDYEIYLRDALLVPLQTGPVGYLQLPADARFAVGYFEGNRVGIPPELGWMEDGPPWHLRGNGGLIASATSLFHWLRATAVGRTLPADWHRRQLMPHAERRDDVSYGYGWGILSRPWGQVVDHTGGNGFFFADARWFREQGLMWAVTANAFDPDQIRELLEGLRAALGISS